MSKHGGNPEDSLTNDTTMLTETVAGGAASTEQALQQAPSAGGAEAGIEVPPDVLLTDVGNLMAFDPRPVDPAPFRTPEGATRACLELGRAVMQALAAEIFALPSVPEKIGRLATLPPPTTLLPREKPIPKPRPPTKWEKFAQSKGIVKRKRSRMEFDEGAGEYRRRHGYKRVRDESDVAIVEAKPGDQVGEDPFEKRKGDKRERVAKQEKNRLQNLKMAAKKGGRAALPSTVQLAATTLPIFGGPQPSARKPTKGGLDVAAGLASGATASGGKFDRKRADERPLQKAGKHRKFMPVVEAEGARGREAQQMRSVLNKVIAKNDFDVMDVGKAVRAGAVAKETAQAKQGRGADVRRGGKGGKKGGKGKDKAATSKMPAKGGKGRGNKSGRAPSTRGGKGRK